MQVLKLPAIAGLIWVSAGFRLLSKQAVRMFSLIVAYFFCLLFVVWIFTVISLQFPENSAARDMVPRVMVFCIEGVLPIFLIGYMQACRDVVRGERITALYFMRGFQQPWPVIASLLGIGLFQVAMMTLTLTLVPESDLFDFNKLAAVAAASQAPLPMDPHDILLQYITAAISIVTLVIVWYAPMMVAWHGMSAGKAMFFSVAACWRNKTAFFMYGVGWVIVGSFFLCAMLLILSTLGTGLLGGALVSVLCLLMIGAMYCSGYVTYSSVFVADAAPLAP